MQNYYSDATITLRWTCLKTIQTNRAFYDLPLSSLLPYSDVKFCRSTCHCPSVTIAKFSHLPVDDFARRKGFSEQPPIPNWRACSFNPKNSVRCYLNSNTHVCLSLSTGTRLWRRSIATSSPFRKKTHSHFYDSTHGWHGWTVWTNNAVEILQRKVSWARVPEIVLQNDPVLFRPKSKKMAGNSIVTFNVVTS